MLVYSTPYMKIPSRKTNVIKVLHNFANECTEWTARRTPVDYSYYSYTPCLILWLGGILQ